MPCPKCGGMHYMSGPSDNDPDTLVFWCMETGCGHEWFVDYRSLSAEIQERIREVKRNLHW
jgi:hypothetical protein